MNDEYKFSGDTLSYWTRFGSFHPSASKIDSRLDVVIIGTGIVGLTAGYLLAKEGRHVTLIDAGPLCAGQTSRTTAHLSFAMDDGFAELIEYHGKEKTALIVDSHRRAIDKIEEIISEIQIECDFARVDGFLFLKPGHSIRYLNDQLQACHDIGLTDVELQNYLPAFKAGACLRFPNQAQFHPLKYCLALASAIEKQGGRILLHQRVKDVEDGTPVIVKLESGEERRASQVIVATNTPIHERFAIHTKQAPYRTYVIAATISKGSLPKALYWDTEDPYHYIRIAPSSDGDEDEDLLIVGGEDHKTGQDEHPTTRFERLERWTRTRFSQIKEFKYRWSGQVYEPIDMAAYIGKSPGDQNIFLATGDSGQGMTHGTIAGMLLTDLLQERSNPWSEIYDPSRLPLRGGVEFFRENVNVAWQYVDYLRPSEVDGVDRIPLCEGAVLRRGAKPIAVHKTMNGKIIERSAVCPHLGCIVHWNVVEKTWDCPCHGSRFNVEGQVITGPATAPLSPVDPDQPGAHNPLRE